VLLHYTPSNLTFGGADGKTLFITARKALYSVRTAVTGAKRP
jgi:gluconolactonase